MSDLNVSSLRFNPLLFDSTLNAHSNETDTDCNIDNVMTCDCSYFDSDTLNQHIKKTNCNLSLYHFIARSLNKHANDRPITNHLATLKCHFKGCRIGPWLVLVSPCFRENVVATCKIGSFFV